MNRKQEPEEANISGDIVSQNPAITPDAVDQETHAPKPGKSTSDEAPPWAAPLRDMYQQVVDEPLPDFLSDLLSRLDRDTE